MKLLFLSVFIFYISTLSPVSGQPSIPFSPCPGSQVLVYKNGTNCTEAPYNFYKVDLSGTLTPFGIPTTAGVEINAISINLVDRFLYGFRYDRTGTISPCTFSNTHLIRADAAGTIDDLGLITPPPGGSVSNAYGAISADGQFLFYSTVGSNIYLGVISSVQTIPSGGPVVPFYLPIINNCPGKSIADWAINPIDGNIYSYATYPETIGATTYMRGVVMMIDLATKTLNCIGAVNTTEFLDPARDNFGGIMFGPDNYLYGVNVNTRKFYKIDVSTGNILLIATFPGSGIMRADLGSCSSASIVVPVKLSDFNATSTGCTATLTWQLNTADDVISQTVMYSSDGRNFTDLYTIRDNKTEKYIDEKSRTGNGYYRLKIIERNLPVTYSPVKFVLNRCSLKKTLTILVNPVTNVLEANYLGSAHQKNLTEILDFSGNRISSGSFISATSVWKIILNTSSLAAGTYMLKVTNEEGNVFTEKFIKK